MMVLRAQGLSVKYWEDDLPEALTESSLKGDFPQEDLC